MKNFKNILVVIVILVLNLSVAFAQKKPSFTAWHQDNTFKVSIVGGGVSTTSFGKIKVEAGAEVAYYHYGWEAGAVVLWADSGEKVNLQEVSLRLRRYLLADAKVAPYASVSLGGTRQATGLVKTGETEQKVKWGAGIVTRDLCFNTQVALGLEWRVAPKLALSVEIGAGYNFKENVNAEETLRLNIDLKDGQDVDLSDIKIKDGDKLKLHGLVKVTYVISGSKKINKSNSKKLTALANY